MAVVEKVEANTERNIPEWVQAQRLRNIARAETAQKIGYAILQGPESRHLIQRS